MIGTCVFVVFVAWFGCYVWLLLKECEDSVRKNASSAAYVRWLDARIELQSVLLEELRNGELRWGKTWTR